MTSAGCSRLFPVIADQVRDLLWRLNYLDGDLSIPLRAHHRFCSVLPVGLGLDLHQISDLADFNQHWWLCLETPLMLP